MTWVNIGAKATSICRASKFLLQAPLQTIKLSLSEFSTTNTFENPPIVLSEAENFDKVYFGTNKYSSQRLLMLFFIFGVY